MNYRTFPLILMLGLVAACSDDDTTETPAGDTAAELLACSSGPLEVGDALRGPGLDPDTGLIGERQASYVISTTQLVVPDGGMQEFGSLVGDIFGDFATREGLVAYAFASDTDCGHQRTLTVWTSQEAMFDFMVGEAHAKAMNATLRISDAGRVTAWEATADEVEAITWDAAVARLAEVENSSIYDR